MNILRMSPESESAGSSGGETAGENNSELAESNKTEEKITMTQEQFDEKIASRLNRQAKKLKEEYTVQKSELEAKITELNEELASFPTEENEVVDKLKVEYESAIKKQSEESKNAKLELERLRNSNRESKKRNEVVSKLAEANAISPNDIWLILQSSGMIGLSEDGDVIPLNSTSGEPLLSGDGKPMDLKTFIEGYLSERPHYVSSSGNRGSGGKGGRATPANGGGIAKDISGVYSDGGFQQIEADMQSKGKLWHGGKIPEWDK